MRYTSVIFLAVGIAIGIGVGLAAVPLSPGQATDRNGSTGILLECDRPECFDFYFSGVIEDISASSISIGQTPNATANGADSSTPVVTISIGPGAPLLLCTENTECALTSYDKIETGSPVCAHARLNPDGSFTVSRFFVNTVCSWQSPPD